MAKSNNGFTRTANGILEQLCQGRLTFRQTRVVLFILRKTVGWNKEFDRISYSQFIKGTRISKWNLGCELKRLIAWGIVLREGEGRKLYYSVQSDISLWQDPNRNSYVTFKEMVPK